MPTWSTAPHALPDGTPVSGAAAAAARALDARAPLSGDPSNTLTEGQTRAELLAYMDDFLWCEETGSGVLRGRRDMWRACPQAEAYSLVAGFLSARVLWARAALAATDPADADALGLARAYLKFCRRGDSVVAARRALDDLRMHRPAAVSALDRGPGALGTPSGVLLLDEMCVRADAEEAQAFLDGRPVEYSLAGLRVTKSTRADPTTEFVPNPHAHVERWDEFVDEICDGDRDKAAFLQRALGYSLRGGNPEKATFVLWGPTRDNGKSTLMNAVKAALGDYADTAPAGLLLAQRAESYTAANPVLAKLVGTRLVDVSEPPAGAELDGAMVKKLASGTDPVSCRALYGREFSYVPDFTLWMHCNALPVVRDPTAVDPRHMFVVEFTRSFGPDERDPGLWGELTTPDGLSTILSWLLEGHAAWRERGLDPPACVTAATEAWLRSSGTWLDLFVGEALERSPSSRIAVGDLKALISAWLEAEGREADALPMRSVNRYLEAAGITRRRSNGATVYAGAAPSEAGRRLLGNVHCPCTERALPSAKAGPRVRLSG